MIEKYKILLMNASHFPNRGQSLELITVLSPSECHRPILFGCV